MNDLNGTLHKRTFLSLFLLLLLAGILGGCHQTSPTSRQVEEAISNVSPAVVKVIAYDKNREVLRYGSGFILEPEGVVASNFHVVRGASQIVVITRNGRSFHVQDVLDANAERDYVLLKIEAKNLPVVQVGKTSRINIGETVIALGHQQEVGFKATAGVLNGRWEEGQRFWMKHTASIAPGSSGGPLVNDEGEVIGINTAYASGTQPLTFAIPIEVIHRSLSQTIVLVAKQGLAAGVRYFSDR